MHYYLFHNDYFNFLSLITVLSGERPIGRLVISKNLISKIASIVSNAGYRAKYVPRSMLSESFLFEGGKNKWKCTKDDIIHLKKNNIYFYISKQNSLIDKLIKYDKVLNIKKIGKMLHYPTCCINKFNKNVEHNCYSEQELLVSAYDYSKNKMQFPFYLNYGTFGKTLILHYPCAYNCKKSIDLAKINLSLVKKVSFEFYKKIISYLKKPVFINENAIVYFKDSGISIGKKYNSKEFIVKGRDYKNIEIFEKGIKADNVFIEGRICYFK